MILFWKLRKSDLTQFYECEMSSLTGEGIRNYSDYSIFEPNHFTEENKILNFIIQNLIHSIHHSIVSFSVVG